MATNTNNQQINVFNKGMNTDTSDAYISSDQYRYAENLRFTMNNESTTGELHTIEGLGDLYVGEIYDRDDDITDDGKVIVYVKTFHYPNSRYPATMYFTLSKPVPFEVQLDVTATYNLQAGVTLGHN